MRAENAAADQATANGSPATSAAVDDLWDDARAYERRHGRQTARDARIVSAFGGLVETMAARSFPSEADWIGSRLEGILTEYLRRQSEVDRLYKVAEGAAE